MKTAHKTFGIGLALVSGIVAACANFGSIPFALELSTNPNSDPRGAWMEIGSALADAFPQHQANQGHVVISYKYCFFACGRYGVTMEKPCEKTFEEVAADLGNLASELVGGGHADMGEGATCSMDPGSGTSWTNSYTAARVCISDDICVTQWVVTGVQEVHEATASCG